ncbi:MAG: bL35 family ribosomal protein [Phycisphaerales bacterium]
MPKNKSHKGLLKRIKITKTGKIRFRAPNGRHLKSNKTGTMVQSYRKNRYARGGDLGALSKMLFRPLRSEEQAEAEELRVEAQKSAEAGSTKAAPAAKKSAPREASGKTSSKPSSKTTKSSATT